jgi:hypothetical protein
LLHAPVEVLVKRDAEVWDEVKVLLPLQARVEVGNHPRIVDHAAPAPNEKQSREDEPAR